MSSNCDAFDEVEFIMAYEGGSLPFDEVVAGFQKLVDSGTVWQLQGSNGRMAASLISAGLVEDRRVHCAS